MEQGLESGNVPHCIPQRNAPSKPDNVDIVVGQQGRSSANVGCKPMNEHHIMTTHSRNTRVLTITDTLLHVLLCLVPPSCWMWRLSLTFPLPRYYFYYCMTLHSSHWILCSLYFKTARKCAVFGICCEPISKQVTYLIDEACTTGKGADTVISFLHHFFEEHSEGETELLLHADNCCGQNKNNAVIQYLAWRTLVTRHKAIQISFMLPGHTKFAPDWFFGL